MPANVRFGQILLKNFLFAAAAKRDSIDVARITGAVFLPI